MTEKAYLDAKNSVQRFLLGIGERMMPVMKESTFAKTGMITPEEFVLAGDFLNFQYPTWQWENGGNAPKDYMPNEKQHITMKGVPCAQRCKDMQSAMEHADHFVEDDDGEGGWLEPQRDNTADRQVTDLTEDLTMKATLQDSAAADEDEDEDDSDVPDLDDVAGQVLVEDDPDELPAAQGTQSQAPDSVLATRRYDLSVTYDNYYRVPRFWLAGYAEDGRPLKPEEMYEDISPDHMDKTVTLETHPFYQTPMVSIHPCKHAEVMQKIVAMAESNGHKVEVYQYLMIFLKFMQAIVPTISYDYSREMYV
eukprot:Clim_evm21s196 gene=Clim_evmTU21s196